MKLFSLFAITDEQAMWRVQMQADPEAFAVLVKRWELPIQNLCTRMLGDVHRGEDLAQEAFTRIFTRREQYIPSNKFSTFLWRVALNLCYDELRKRQRRRETSLETEFEADADFPSLEPTPDISLAQEENAAGVRHALGQVDEAYRTVLILRHYEGLKFREIAEVLGIPEGTVKSRMGEGLNQLAKLMQSAERRERRAIAAWTDRRKEVLIL